MIRWLRWKLRRIRHPYLKDTEDFNIAETEKKLKEWEQEKCHLWNSSNSLKS